AGLGRAHDLLLGDDALVDALASAPQGFGLRRFARVLQPELEPAGPDRLALIEHAADEGGKLGICREDDLFGFPAFGLSRAWFSLLLWRRSVGRLRRDLLAHRFGEGVAQPLPHHGADRLAVDRRLLCAHCKLPSACSAAWAAARMFDSVPLR